MRKMDNQMQLLILDLDSMIPENRRKWDLTILRPNLAASDENIHRQLMKNDCSCISILFEKSSGNTADVRYKASVFLLSANGEHINITDSTIW